MTRILFFTVAIQLLLAFPVKAELPPSFPGLDDLIKESDAVVVVRIKDEVLKAGRPEEDYSVYECTIDHSLKGEIKVGETIKTKLIKIGYTPEYPFAVRSIHLLFLSKKQGLNSSIEYLMLKYPGADVLLDPWMQHRTLIGKTLEENIHQLIEEALSFNYKQFVRKQVFLGKMIDNGADSESVQDSIHYEETKPVECALRYIIEQGISVQNYDLKNPIFGRNYRQQPYPVSDWLVSFRHKSEAAGRLRFAVRDYGREVWQLDPKTLKKLEEKPTEADK